MDIITSKLLNYVHQYLYFNWENNRFDENSATLIKPFIKWYLEWIGVNKLGVEETAKVLGSNGHQL